jgi:DNA/RNA endonuclease G (NUC1)
MSFRKALTITSLSVLFALLFTACGSEDKVETIPVLTVKTNPVTAASGSQFISVTATSSWTLSITYPSGATDNWASLSTTTGSGSTSTIVLSYTENTETTARPLTLTVTAGSKSTSVQFSQNGKSSTGGGGTGGGGETGGGSTTSSKWLELPATSASDGYDFFTHSMSIGSVKTRNYSFYWDYTNLVARWVAYPLCGWNIGSSTGRTDAWGLDPLLSRDKQPVLFKAYASGNDGWRARGHQIPSADRLTSVASNNMTFYFTNMTPQIQDNFNGGIWANLESKVRSWAQSSDTLYVVTGCVPEGSTKYCYDNDGKKVTIPVGYYKAVLRYSKSTTLGYSGFMACAVYLSHKEYADGSITSSYSMSIDDLEKKLGIDLFVNLPTAIGKETADKVEAQEPSTVSWWW